MPYGSNRRKPKSTPHVFLEVSRYRVHNLWLSNCVQRLVKIEFDNVQELEPINASFMLSSNV